jgi:two-component system response regulator ChvI
VAGQGIDGHRTTIRSFIKRIRKKFRAVHPTFDQIQNYPGFGYRWISE